jgi:hypothetical protein
MLELEYARSALKNGLKLEQQLGVNPYKFGTIGSTDAHIGLAAVEEENFFGKASKAWRPLAAEPGHVVVTQGKLETLAATFARIWQRLPTSTN